ncbi:hypothetical protein Trydic_g14723 [Trypoxylus dichotomus]
MSKTASENACPRYARNRKKPNSKSVNFQDLNPTNSVQQTRSSNTSATDDKSTISNLMVDLAQALSENVRLTNENELVKIDVRQCNERIKEIESTLNEERIKFAKSLQCINEKLSKAEYLLADTERQLIEENEKHVSKVNNLRVIYVQERDFLRTKENRMNDEMDNLKKQLGKSKEYMENLLGQLKNAKAKICMYKEKLKFCVHLITDMNAFLNTGEIDKSEKESQTDSRLVKASHKQCNCRGCSLECENIVLSDLFFRMHGALQTTLDDVLFSLNHNA